MLTSRCHSGMMSSGQMLKMVVYGGACGRGHERGVELNHLLPCFKNSTRRCHIGVLNEKLAFNKRTTKSVLRHILS